MPEDAPHAPDPQTDADLGRIQEKIAWIIRLGEFHRFHRGEAGGEPELDRTTFLLLSHLAESEAMTMTEIAEHLDLTPSTATRRVTPLVDGGLLQRERHPEDHRTALISITDTGRERARAVRESRVETLRETFRAWDASELSELADVMDRLSDTLAVELTRDTEFSGRHLGGI